MIDFKECDMSPKVSVIMPSLNVGKYIKKCITSVCRQTLQDIEIICVDAGSTDGTLEILEEAAAADERIRIIHSDVKSYGYQMNLGLDAAQGRYIGIIETDDFADKDMFKTLYKTACEDKLDVVKSDFWFYYSKPEVKNTLYKLPGYLVRKGVFCPYSGFVNPEEQADLFNIKASIWSAIYRRQFLVQNNIRFNETPGAAFQDTAFNFKVWACAKNARLIKDAFVHYRQDNEQSSVNSPSKVFNICAEYQEIERFISERYFEDKHRQNVLNALMMRLKYDAYMWNYDRLAEPLNHEFARGVQKELRSDLEKKYMNEDYFPPYKSEGLKMWANDVESFIEAMDAQNQRSFAARVIDKIKRSLKH